jgi:hypothetical protein
MFQVYDGNKPADCANHKVHESWDKSLYCTFEEALGYADKWLGIYSPGIEVLKTNIPYDYSGYGDIVDIRKV